MAHQFKKKFGQNFLKSSRFAKELTESLAANEDETIIEIGPGDGFVTKYLLETGAQVISIEVDYSLIPKLIKKFNKVEKFDLVHQDILDVNFPEVLREFSATKKLHFVGSLPYNISKPIIKKCLYFASQNHEYEVTNMSFIVQEEVAKQVVAQPPKSTFLHNFIQSYAHVKKAHTIPASQFFPEPKVNGAIITITPHNETLEKEKLTKLIKIGFSSPRKTLKNNLQNSRKYSKESIRGAFDSMGISDTARASEIEFEQWKEMHNKLITAST